VDDLLVFWRTGVFYSRTFNYSSGRLARCALVPVVCDLLAARQVSGFGAHNAKYFCSICKLLHQDRNNIDFRNWPMRSREEHREAALAWRDKSSKSQRKRAFRENSVRYSVLLELPYWDPILYTVVDSMHNHYLGLLQFHVRDLWGMAADGDDGQPEEEVPLDLEDIRNAEFQLTKGSKTSLKKCSQPILLYLCSVRKIVPENKATKRSMVDALMDWVSGVLSAAPQNLRDSVELLKKALRDRKASSSISRNFAAGALQALCRELGISPGGNKKDDAINALISSHLKKQPQHTAGPSSAPSSSSTSTPRASEPPHNEDPVRAFYRGERQSVVVLGRHLLQKVHEAMPKTLLPSWMNPVPANVGMKARGKLSADQWHTFCVVNLPVVLIPLWHGQDERERGMLNNFMDLVTMIVIGGLLEMSEDKASLYEEVASRYLKKALELYDFTVTPNQHNSLHIPVFFRLFGPLHSIRTFFSERENFKLQRRNTNSKFGELEITYVNQSCREANLRVLAADERIREDVAEIVQAFERDATEDRRGTRLREANALGIGLVPHNQHKPREPAALDDHCFEALVKFFNTNTHGQRYASYNDGPMEDDHVILLFNSAVPCDGVYAHGVTFRSFSKSQKDCNVLFRSKTAQQGILAGRINHVFKYATSSEPEECTYLFVTPLLELTTADAEHDPFRSYPLVGGQLYYGEYAEPIIIAADQLVSHFARTPIEIANIEKSCIHVLPLDKVN
ncbi:uncharacterized protein BXZ73DRAFT_34095, partial [Epithele typhae]|uniref:uncharacterized protein n=1 Tax=Epithele typhae TaxID=378194 RepID=UPI002008E19B